MLKSMKSKKESKKKGLWSTLCGMKLNIFLILLIPLMGLIFATPYRADTVQGVWHNTYEYLRHHNIHKESNKRIKARRIYLWNNELIPYPIKDEFLSLPMIAHQRVSVAMRKGLYSKEYKKILNESNAVYYGALNKVPKDDPVWASLWMAYEYQFLTSIGKPLSDEETKEIYNIIELLLNAKHSNAKNFIEFRRFAYIVKILSFLEKCRKKSLCKADPALLYKYAKDLSGFIYDLDNKNKSKQYPDLKFFLTAHMILIDICIFRLETGGITNQQEAKDFIKENIIRAEFYATKFLEEEPIVAEYKELKQDAVAIL